MAVGRYSLGADVLYAPASATRAAFPTCMCLVPARSSWYQLGTHLRTALHQIPKIVVLYGNEGGDGQGIPQNRKDQLLGVCTARISLARLLYRQPQPRPLRSKNSRAFMLYTIKAETNVFSSSPQNHVEREPIDVQLDFVLFLRESFSNPSLTRENVLIFS
jgi:hypothetical protein